MGLFVAHGPGSYRDSKRDRLVRVVLLGALLLSRLLFYSLLHFLHPTSVGLLEALYHRARRLRAIVSRLRGPATRDRGVLYTVDFLRARFSQGSDDGGVLVLYRGNLLAIGDQSYRNFNASYGHRLVANVGLGAGYVYRGVHSLFLARLDLYFLSSVLGYAGVRRDVFQVLVRLAVGSYLRSASNFFREGVFALSAYRILDCVR